MNNRKRELIVGVAALLSLAAVGSAVAASGFDPGFGQGGVVETPLPADERQIVSENRQGPLIWDLAFGQQGFVAAVASGTVNTYFGAASYRAGGTPDPQFDGDGFLVVKKFYPQFSSRAQAQGVALQRDGKIVLVGYRTSGDRYTAPIVMRLRSDGRPDRRFGSGGLIPPEDDPARPELLHDVAVQPGGRIIAVGSRDETRGRRPAGIVVAYRKDGRLDRRFGDNGRVIFANRRHGIELTGLFGVSVLPSGKILVAGYRNNRLFVSRLGVNGRLDRGFGGGDGKVSIDLGIEGCCPERASVVVLRDGSSIVLSNQNYPGLVLLRLRPNGMLDPHFGRHGLVKLGIAKGPGSPHDLAVQRNGRIVVVGLRKHVFVMTRFRPDGRVDRSFGKAGVQSVLLGRASAGTSAVTLPNGRVVVGGGAQYRKGDELEYSLLLARLRP